jgi:hypothetical protein
MTISDGDMTIGGLLRRWPREVVIGRWFGNGSAALLAEFSVGPTDKSTLGTFCACHFYSL